jgi:3-deoxy-D-manno-octulosonic acid kinase
MLGSVTQGGPSSEVAGTTGDLQSTPEEERMVDFVDAVAGDTQNTWQRLLGDRYLWTGADRTRAFREWRLLRELRAAGLPVPVPVAARYARRGLFYRADLVTEELPTRRTLAQALTAAPLDAATWRAVGACVGRLHAHGVHHADLNAHNLLLGPRGEVHVLDFDRGRIRPRGTWEQAVVERLQRSLRKVTAGLPPDRFDAAAWQALLLGLKDA